MIKRTNDKLDTKVYRKDTNTDIYINWYSHSPRIWKINTLKGLIKRAIGICSTTEYLNEELMHLKNVFVEINQYPQKLVDKIIQEEMEKQNNDAEINTEEQSVTEKHNDNSTNLSLNLPYGGIRGENLITKMKKDIGNKLGNNVKLRVTYTARKLGSKFQLKDPIKKEHLHNITYNVDCPNQECQSTYIGQTKSRCNKRIMDHNGRDKSSHVWKHSKEKSHTRIWMKDATVLGKGYKNDFNRKISESLFIRELKPDLNVQKDAYKLKLFN